MNVFMTLNKKELDATLMKYEPVLRENTKRMQHWLTTTTTLRREETKRRGEAVNATP